MKQYKFVVSIGRYSWSMEVIASSWYEAAVRGHSTFVLEKTNGGLDYRYEVDVEVTCTDEGLDNTPVEFWFSNPKAIRIADKN